MFFAGGRRRATKYARPVLQQRKGEVVLCVFRLQKIRHAPSPTVNVSYRKSVPKIWGSAVRNNQLSNPHLFTHQVTFLSERQAICWVRYKISPQTLNVSRRRVLRVVLQMEINLLLSLGQFGLASVLFLVLAPRHVFNCIHLSFLEQREQRFACMSSFEQS